MNFIPVATLHPISVVLIHTGGVHIPNLVLSLRFNGEQTID